MISCSKGRLIQEERFDSNKAGRVGKGQITKVPGFQDKELECHPGDHGLPMKGSGLKGRAQVIVRYECYGIDWKQEAS